MTQTPFTIVFAIYDGMTHLDFTGPHQVLARTPNAKVIVASLNGGTVRAEDNLGFAGTAKLSDIETCDLICVPGGSNALELANNDDFIAHIKRLGATAKYITSVCTGSLILGAAGLLKGKRAACHWAWRDLLSEFGAEPVAERVVRDGNIFTGGGVTAGVDFGFTVLAELAGQEMAEAIQLGLEYDPQPPFDRGAPNKARPEILELVMGFMRKMGDQRREDALRAASKL